MKNLWVRLSDFQVVNGRAVELQSELSSIQFIASLENSTEVTEFILPELNNAPELQGPLFITFTLIYLISVVGNLGTTQLILLDCRLHTPMYFSLSNLSLAGFGYSAAVNHKVIAGFLVGDKVISCNVCAAQMFFLSAFATVENALLASMAYNRFTAVCRPLHYTTIMATSWCACLAIGSCVYGFPNASIRVRDTFSLSFCTSKLIHHFFCDAPAVMTLSCSDRHISELLLIVVASFNILFCPPSYLDFLPVHMCHHPEDALGLGIPEGFIHLPVSPHHSLHLHRTVIFIYSQPSSSRSIHAEKWRPCSEVIPMLNPVVYSLRNKVKSAFKKAIEKAKLSLSFIS